ncbi:sigma-70 family RNA polymerase sigma factor [Jatrophihabitans telluris]|uniref:Sigma-70 family RNA polymerase sigma factor n=1 Tax=Jatrophihabitans telluris TaxID=2038343 RepID=A0ABY4R1C7_9ACTN|nr:sigma-70 family RNA polymerase sigma factor [Jatrophihabitans telluris]UQX89272.1 sigma-70 family RNA polymerase sigma factor [Jatrophihabitans telluris]
MRAGSFDTDSELVDRLRAGDEVAFMDLVGRYQPQLIRLARSFVTRAETAEDVVQETWLALLTGIDRFEGRSSLRTWLLQICVNRARSTAVQEQRTLPVEQIGPVVDAEHFTESGAWTSPPTPWPDLAADAARDAELAARIRAAVEDLPPMQRAVVTLRDVEGLTGAQTCAVLSITDANQRVLLHRGREHLRTVITKAVSAQ